MFDKETYSTMMDWKVAVQKARREDVTEAEWRDLYYPRHTEPTQGQIERCVTTARAILLRTGQITENTVIESAVTHG